MDDNLKKVAGNNVVVLDHSKTRKGRVTFQWYANMSLFYVWQLIALALTVGIIFGNDNNLPEPSFIVAILTVTNSFNLISLFLTRSIK